MFNTSIALKPRKIDEMFCVFSYQSLFNKTTIKFSPFPYEMVINKCLQWNIRILLAYCCPSKLFLQFLCIQVSFSKNLKFIL